MAQPSTPSANPRIEARGYALLLARRALQETLSGLPEALLWKAPGEASASIGEIARAAWTREMYWIWPQGALAPELEERPSLAGVLYGLVRFRGVTEELLMRSSDADLDRPYVSDMRSQDGSEPRTLDWIVAELIRSELFDTAQLQYVRGLWQPEWFGARETWDRAAEFLS